MMNYRLVSAEVDWREALFALNQELPVEIHLNNLEALRLLPIFAVVVVVDSAVLGSHQKTPNDVLKQWATSDGNWHLHQVGNAQSEPVSICVPKTVSEVCVFRYVLFPKDKSRITADRRDAVAHILDEQLTAHLKRALKPTTDYHYKVDSTGQISDFTFDIPKQQPYIDCHILSITQMLRRHKLACFDMDSTLITQEVIIELAKKAGVGDKVAAITESAMKGEIDFATSFAKRVALLKDLDASIIDAIISELTLQDGALMTIKSLKALGYRTVLISGGFTPFAKHVATVLGMDDYYANPLDIQNGKLTGEVILPILDAKQKARLTAKIADEMSIDLSEVICVGDGANDLPMMALSDLGIAYRAKPIVQVKADAAVNITGLEGVLYALGHHILDSDTQNSNTQDFNT